VTAQSPGPAQATHPKLPRQPAKDQGGILVQGVLELVGWLIGYGKNLSAKLRQHAGSLNAGHLTRRFGTADLTPILRRITRGLMLAAALHQRLSQRAARGRDLTPSLPLLPWPRQPQTPRPRPQQARPQPAPDVVTLPTPREIAALLRRKPVGAVIADICRDLAIVPGSVPTALWDELSAAIVIYGGSLSRYRADMSHPLRVLASPCARDPAAQRIDGGGVTTPNVSPSPCERVVPQGESMPRSGPMGERVAKPQTAAPLAVATGPP
jgi:hypothetical protein